MPDRALAKDDFLTGCGWADAQRANLAGDASLRRYERLARPDGTTAVLMDAPPSSGEQLGSFVRIARFLRTIGLSAPAILAEDQEHGFLLLEDLGNGLFARHIQCHPQEEYSLYQAAVDVLGHLQRNPPPPLEPYDAAQMSAMSDPAFTWYTSGVSDVSAEVRARFREILEPFDTDANVIALRDYHAENLLWLSYRKGLSRVGLLDFQDAVICHPAYDLVSLLQDARRDVPRPLEQAMIAYFCEVQQVDPARFAAAYAAIGAQRQLRIVGVFARLCVRDAKPQYLSFLPRVWALLQRNLEHPGLDAMSRLIADHLPPPDAEHLAKLKAQCPKDQMP